jgi:phosphoglycerate dehydrogenase-like enzyme
VTGRQRTLGVVLAVSRRRITPGDVQAIDPLTRTVEVADGVPVPDLGEAEILIGNPPAGRCAELVDRMPRLRWFHAAAAGVDRFVPTLAGRPDIVLTNDRTSHALPMAEFILGTVFSISKRFAQQRDAQIGRDWLGGRTGPELQQVSGKRLCVVGLGAIGTEVARLASACGMAVVGVRRDSTAHPLVGVVYPPERITEAVADADFVVLACPLTSETKGLVSARVLAALPPRAWLINVARGEVVDEDALFEALAARRIAGAALDTVWVEPLPADSRWWTLDNVLITPHRAASSVENRAPMLALLAENLRRYRAGEELLNRIDVRRGY